MTKHPRLRQVACILAAGYAPISIVHMLYYGVTGMDLLFLRTWVITPLFGALLIGGIAVAIGISMRSMWAWWIGMMVSIFLLYPRIGMMVSDLQDPSAHFPFIPLGLTIIWLLIFMLLLLHPSIRSDLKEHSKQ